VGDGALFVFYLRARYFLDGSSFPCQRQALPGATKSIFESISTSTTKYFSKELLSTAH
jgi:hypothetical protein